MFRLNRHSRLLLRRQLKELLGCQIIEHISGVKHFTVIAVDFFCRINTFVTEVVGHLGTDLVDLRDIKHHNAISHLLGNVAVRVCLASGALSSARAAVEISSVLIMGGFMAECKKYVIAGSQRRRVHPDYNASVRHRSASVQRIQHIVRLIDPFHHRIPCRPFFLDSRFRCRAFRKSQPGVILDIHKTVQLLHSIAHPL